MENKSDISLEKAILQTAEKLFLEKGYEATSTVQIAKAVGCNQALVHYYYRTKDNLFNTIFESKFKVFIEKFFDLSKVENQSFVDKIILFSDSHYDLLFENPDLPKLILKELSRKPESIKTLREKLHVLPEKIFISLNEELEKEIESGIIRNMSLMDIIITIVSLNIAIFIMIPIASGLLGMDEKMKNFILQHRREENKVLILSYLKP